MIFHQKRQHISLRRTRSSSNTFSIIRVDYTIRRLERRTLMTWHWDTHLPHTMATSPWNNISRSFEYVLKLSSMVFAGTDIIALVYREDFLQSLWPLSLAQAVSSQLIKQLYGWHTILTNVYDALGNYGWGCDILGFIIERTTGKSLHEYWYAFNHFVATLYIKF